MLRGPPTVRTLVVVLVAIGVLATPTTVDTGAHTSTNASVGRASEGAAVASPVNPRVVEVAPAFHPSPATRTIGPMPAAAPMTVAVGLASQDPGGLSAYLAAEYGSGTPARGNHPSVDELAARYGASASSIASAKAYFAADGLSVTVSPDHLLLFVQGPSGVIGSAFGTTFTLYATASGREFFSHSTPAMLPDSAGWSGVLGLGNSTEILPASASYRGEIGSVPASGAPCSATPAGLAPCQIWDAYDFDPLFANGTDGSGFTIAIVDAYSSDEGQFDLEYDLDLFANAFDLSPANVHFLYPVPALIDLNTSNVNSDWAAEDALDLEWARAAAPGATINDTFSPNSGIGLYEAVDWLVAHQAANVISLSWGEPDVGIYNEYDTPCPSACNASTDGSYAILSPVLQFAAAEGISIFAATGDCGAADGTSGVATNYPASDPSVTGVGGTVLNVSLAGTYLGEEGWSGNDSGAAPPGCQNQGGSGGGFAPFPRPWWQVGLPGTPSTRGVPDVAMVAGNATSIYLHGDLGGVAGTSLATPIWAGIAADLDQSTGRPLGFLNPALYRVYDSLGYGYAFHDILSGWNGYFAGAGWDPVTGIGTPIVSALAEELAAASSPTSTSGLTTNLTALPATGAVPLLVTFTVRASGGTGIYELVGVYFGDGTAGFAPDGSVTHQYPQPGVYPAQSYVVDSSGNLSTSSPVLVVVGGGGILVVNLDASDATPAVRWPVTFTASAAGGHAPYMYSYFFGDGTFLNNTTSPSVVHTYGATGEFCASVVVSDSGNPVGGGVSGGVGIGVGNAPVPVCESGYPGLDLEGNLSTDHGTVPLTITYFANASLGTGGPYGYAWSFGNRMVGDASSGTQTFLAPGVYTVILNASDAAGDHASLSWTVTVTGRAGPHMFPTAALLLAGGGAGAVIGVVAVVWPRRKAPAPPPVPPVSVNP